MIKSTSERFYLSKREKTIFIDNIVNIPQNYLDGIRFLYRSFNKKKPGVILNDQSNESRNTQVVLFLKAVQQLIKKTILILCPEGQEDAWLSLFYQCTDLDDDVIIEFAKPYIRKKVLINPSQELPSFCSREWGVMVVDDDGSMLDVLRLPFKADFKIWSSPVKMTENLHMFSHIYEWLYPKGMFNVKDFLSDKRNPCDVMDKAIFLEAFLRDVVLRREDPDHFKKEQPSPTLPKVTRKNKDATGTKIKRSKPKPVDVPTTAQVSTSDVVQTQNDNENNVETKEELNIGNDKQNKKEYDEKPNSDEIGDDSELKIKNLKKKKDVIEESEIVNKDINILQTEDSVQSDVKLYYECTEANDSDKMYEMDTLPLDDEVLNDESRNTDGNKHEETVTENSDKINIETNEVDINNKEPIKTETDQDSEEKNYITHSKKEMTDEKVCLDNNKTILNNGENSVNTLDEMQSDDKAAKESIEANIVTAMMNELNNDQKHNDEVSVPATNNLKREIEDKFIEMEAKAIKKFKGSILDSNIEHKHNDEVSVPATNDLKRGIEDKNMEIEAKAINKFKGSILDLNNEQKHNDEVSVPATNDLKRGIEDKIMEMEAKAMKKYKGSILDSLF